MRAFGLAALGCALGAVLPFRGQAQDVGARLAGRAPGEVVRAVQDIARGAATDGLPVEPLIQKAIEGSAKGVAPDRVVAAVRMLAARLGEAQGALRDAGIAAPSGEAVEGGAYALDAGLNAGQVRDLARVSRPPYDPALMLRVAATLGALGVPGPQAVRLMQGMIKTGRTPSDLLALPSKAQADMARGATPAEAAEGLARGAPHIPPGGSRRPSTGPQNP
ncbi:MAG TPA: hypothetical protein VH158_07600 [Gemmatimonadales bacterium]|nr:hypothetical protein [Gemmatimonadales bacterium]